MIFMAIEETIFLIISSIPFIFIKSNTSNKIVFEDFLGFLSGINLLYSIVIFLSNFFHEAFLLIIIDRFSPSHLPLGFIMNSFLYNIYRIIKNKIKGNKIEFFLYAYIFIYAILFIAAMIHNEIFIINLCGFNANTKLFLDDKVKQERKESEIFANDEEFYDDEEQTPQTEEKLTLLEDKSSKD